MRSKHIYISDTLYNYLNQIKEDSPIAALLASQNIEASKLVDDHIDFLSISVEDPYKISYLTTERIAKLEKSKEDLWISPSRYHTKYGSFVNKVFNCFDNREVEKFSNLLRAVVSNQNVEFKVIDGEEIIKYYHHSSYSEQAGTLGQSCMKHDVCANFLNIYTENPEVVKMLVALDINKNLIGRALLWEFESYRVMDRIYTINDENWSYYFKQWANKNNFIYKAKQNWNWTFHFESSGKKLQQKLSVKLSNYSFDYYPYVDTFKWLNTETGEIFNYKPDEDSNIRILMSGDGSMCRNANALAIDSMTEAYDHRELLKSLNYRSTKDNSFQTSESNVVWSSINDCYILREDSEYMSQFDDHIFKKEFEHYNDRGVIDQRLEKIKNRDVVIKEEFSKIDNKNKVISEEEILELLNNNYHGVYDRSDIVSIMTTYLEQRTAEIEERHTSRRRRRPSSYSIIDEISETLNEIIPQQVTETSDDN